MLYLTKNPHGGDIYGDPVKLDFSANTNPYGTPPGVQAAVREAAAHLDRYPDPYCRKLVAAIADYEQVPRAQILCGSGAAELIYSYALALQPRTALELAPTFSEYALGLEQTGCRISRYELQESRDFLPGEDFFGRLRAEKPDVLFLCNPNNPTGKLLDPEYLKKVLKICKEEHIHLFLDECFLDLTEHGKSMKEFLSQYPELFILKAFTKSYGMAGVRLGYGLCGDPLLLQKMSRAVQPWNISSLAQAAGAAALQEGDFLKKTVQTVSQQRIWLQRQLEGFGFRVCSSETNFLLFHGPDFLWHELKKRGIAIRSCDNYWGLGPGWYRIAVRLPEENQALITEISNISQSYKER